MIAPTARFVYEHVLKPAARALKRIMINMKVAYAFVVTQARNARTPLRRVRDKVSAFFERIEHITYDWIPKADESKFQF